MYIKWKWIWWRNKRIQVLGNSILLLKIANNKQLQRGRRNLYWEICGRLQSGKREAGCRISKLIPLTRLPQINRWNMVDPYSGWERQQAVILSSPLSFFCSQRAEGWAHPALQLLPALEEPDKEHHPHFQLPDWTASSEFTCLLLFLHGLPNLHFQGSWYILIQMIWSV